jgi:hypothetical protein
LALPEGRFYELLQYVRAMSTGTGGSLGQRGNTLYLLDADGAFEVVTRTYTLAPKSIEVLRSEGPEQFLGKHGVRFDYEGTFAEITSAGKLRICNTQENLDLIGTLGFTPDPSILEMLKRTLVDVMNG